MNHINWATGEIPAQAVSAGPWPVTISGGPSITSVELVGRDEIQITFDEGVYSFGGGALQPSHFVLNCAGQTIGDVVHAPGDVTATLVLSSLMDGFEITTCIDSGEAVVAALAVYNAAGNPAATTSTPITMAAWACPTGATLFQLNEPAASPYAFDQQDRLIGTVSSPSFSFIGDGTFLGAEGNNTSVDFANNLTCLKESDTLTIEARIRPTEVDRGIGDNTFNRIFERRRTILVTFLNTDYRGDDVPARAGKGSIEVKYRTDATARHTCPHPHWPDDTYTGNDVRMHQISSDIERWPMVDGHWYLVKVVFNSGKGPLYGTPVDIYLDDQGTDGLNTPNPTPLDPTSNPDSEQWPGYVNATKTINGSSSCRWGSLPGDFIEPRDETSHIGAAWNHNQPFAGQIDWVTWAPVADYSGVDDLVNFGDPPTNVTATPGDAAVDVSWDAVTEATSYIVYWATAPSVTRLSGTRVTGATSPATIAGLANGTAYYFTVTSVFSEGESGPAVEATATPTTP